MMEVKEEEGEGEGRRKIYIEAFLTDCGVAGIRSCSVTRELRCGGTARAVPGVRGPLVEGGKRRPPPLGMACRGTAALGPDSAVCTTT